MDKTLKNECSYCCFMASLEGLKKKVEDFCTGKFDIFFSDNAPSQVYKDKTIMWRKIDSVEDANSFLDFLATHNKEKTVFVFAGRIKNGDNFNREHIDEIASLEVGFMIGGIYHCMIVTADWFYI